jgi:ubiquinone/menaquinone biosynthesis C-methylase UbiE
MKRLRTDNPNTPEFWDKAYAPEGREHYYQSVFTLEPSKRFEYALTQVKVGDRVLDMGCGMGHFTRLVKKTYPTCEVWGFDIAPQMMADNREAEPRNDYLVGEIGYTTDIPFSYFNVVFCGEVIEHLDEPQVVFIEAKRYLQPHGRLVITCPNGKHGELSEDHLWIFEKEDVLNLLKEYGYVHTQIVYLPTDIGDQIIFATGDKP